MKIVLIKSNILNICWRNKAWATAIGWGPVTVSEKFVKSNDIEELADATSCRSLIESLLFVAKQTRPDNIYGAKILSRFIDNPRKAPMQGAKRIMRYLHGTSKLKIVYRKQKTSSLLGESDTDWSGDQKDRKWTTIFISKMVRTMVLSHGKWESNKQWSFQALKQSIKV